MTLDTKTFDVATLRPFHKNPRRGDVAKIAESLTANGQFRAIVVNRGTQTGREFEVLAGNHTLAAAKELGWTEIVGHLIDVDESQARKIVLVDNRTNDLATTDDSVLLDLLREDSGELDGTGYGQEDVDAIAALLREHDWGQEDPQGALDDADESGWPKINATVNPATYDRWLEVPGEDDAAKIVLLLDKGGF